MNRAWLRRPRASARGAREARIAELLELAERFVYDVGLLLAGDRAGIDAYVAPGSVARLRTTLGALGVASRLQPEFAEHALVTVTGDVLDRSAPLRCSVEFEDRSAWLDGDITAPRPRRRVRVRMLVDPATIRVLDHRVESADG